MGTEWMAHWDGDRMAHRDAPAPCSAQDLLKGCLHGQDRPQAHQRGGQEMSSPHAGPKEGDGMEGQGGLARHCGHEWHNALARYGERRQRGERARCCSLAWWGELAQLGDLPRCGDLARR